MKNFEEVISKIKSFISDNPLNRMGEQDLPIYEEPLVGLASAGDPIFDRLKDPEVIGPKHLSPREWLPEAETVISYFLPLNTEIRRANYNSGCPADEWLYGRIEGKAFNYTFLEYLVKEFNDAGAKVVSPITQPQFFISKGISNWSERHVAYIAGLGTFGLNKALITQRGCAGRLGSIITSFKYEPVSRPYHDIYEYCTWCEECIKRCPPGALSKEKFDGRACSKYMPPGTANSSYPRFMCGKCQTAVPCEDCIP